MKKTKIAAVVACSALALFACDQGLSVSEKNEAPTLLPDEEIVWHGRRDERAAAEKYVSPGESEFSVTVVYTADGLALPFKVKAKIGFDQLLLTFVSKNDAIAAIEALKGAGIAAKMTGFGRKYEVSAPLTNIVRVNVAGKPVYPIFF